MRRLTVQSLPLQFVLLGLANLPLKHCWYAVLTKHLTSYFWAWIIKLITAVIYGYRNKIEYLISSTRLGWKGLQGQTL